MVWCKTTFIRGRSEVVKLINALREDAVKFTCFGEIGGVYTVRVDKFYHGDCLKGDSGHRRWWSCA